MVGKALIIALNNVDPNQYAGWDGALKVCEEDGLQMEKLLKKNKFTSTVLLSAAATRVNVLNEIDAAAKTLKNGDCFVLYYSGHGGQLPDTNSKKIVDGGDEADGLDETWCLYDGELIDDILFQRWFKFKKGVRILVISDSCHSGSVIKAVNSHTLKNVKPEDEPEKVYKIMPQDVAVEVYAKHAKEYKAFNKAECPLRVSKTAPISKNDIKASVLLMSGCQDNQFSQAQTFAYPNNSFFTAVLLKLVSKKKPPTNYPSLLKSIRLNLPDDQQPNLMTLGQLNTEFETQKPFKLV